MSNLLQDGQTLRTNSDGSRAVLDRNGKVIEVVEDGARVRVPMIFMDAAKKPAERKPLALVDASAHRPGPVVAVTADMSPAMAAVTPEQRAQFDEKYAKHKKAIARRWRNVEV